MRELWPRDVGSLVRRRLPLDCELQAGTEGRAVRFSAGHALGRGLVTTPRPMVLCARALPLARPVGSFLNVRWEWLLGFSGRRRGLGPEGSGYCEADATVSLGPWATVPPQACQRPAGEEGTRVRAPRRPSS